MCDSAATAASSIDPRPDVVIDTNVVLDIWLFEDATSQPLRAALQEGSLRWIAAPAMLAELALVLERPFALQRCPEATTLLRAIQPLCTLLPAPEPLQHGLRCRDAEDQKFIDLALQQQARWLVTRDRALLDLRRRAARLGVNVLTPREWVTDSTPQH